MKILFQARPDFMKNPAGDTVQIVSTGQALKALGIEAHFSSDPNIDVSSYDLVHIFNITRIKESYMFFLNAQKQGKKLLYLLFIGLLMLILTVKEQVLTLLLLGNMRNL